MALTLLPNAGTPEVLPVRDVAMDGAIIYSCSATESSFGWLRKRRLPLVLVDEPDGGDLDAYSSVNVDDRAGARAAAAHLVALGHRRIAVFTVGPADRHAASGSCRRNGCGAGATCWSPPGSSRVVLHLDRDVGGASGIAAVRELLTRPGPPTAVLCFSDSLAADVLRAAADLGVRVPTELSVVGFDDSSLARRLSPPLTTVTQDVVAKGTLAADRAHQGGAQAAGGRARAGAPPPAAHRAGGPRHHRAPA